MQLKACALVCTIYSLAIMHLSFLDIFQLHGLCSFQEMGNIQMRKTTVMIRAVISFFSFAMATTSKANILIINILLSLQTQGGYMTQVETAPAQVCSSSVQELVATVLPLCGCDL